MVEAILRVQSVDLVADPATTHGLFESADASGAAPAKGDEPLAEGEKPSAAAAAEPKQLPWSEVTVEGLAKHRPELVEAIRGQRVAELARLQGRIDQLEAAETLRQKRGRLRQLLQEFELPDPDAPTATPTPLSVPASLKPCWPPPATRPCGR